jgi:hypothetical protein
VRDRATRPVAAQEKETRSTDLANADALGAGLMSIKSMNAQQ